MKKAEIVNQKPRKEIIAKLQELKIHDLWVLALSGNTEAQKKLANLSQENNEIREALELTKPRRNPSKKKKHRNTTAMESGKIYSTGWVTIHRG